MRYTARIFLFLIILGIIFVRCYLKPEFKVNPVQYTGPQTVEALTGMSDTRYSETNRATPEIKDWIVINETAVPNIPGIIYVQKTESTANIWHTTRSVANLEAGGILPIEGSEVSERQRLNLLNTGVVPKGWEVVYVDEEGNPIR